MRAGHLEHGARAHEAGLERGRDRDDLVGRSGLEHVGERAVRARWRYAGCAGASAVAPSTVAIARMSPVRTSAMTTVPPLASCGLDLLGEHALDLVLQRLVDREHEVGASLGGPHAALAVGQVAALRVLLDLAC